MAALDGGTSVRSAIRGYVLGGIGVPLLTQSVNAFSSAALIGAAGRRIAHQIACAQRRVDGLGRNAEATLPSAVRDAGKVITPNFRWKRDIFLRGGTDQRIRLTQAPDLGRTKRLQNLRAGVRPAAAIEHARHAVPAHRIAPLSPPARRFVAQLVQKHVPARQRKPAVQVDVSTSDIRIRAVPYLASGFILVESQHDEQLQERSRLRAALGDRPVDAACERVRRSCRVLLLVPEEGIDVSRRREPHAEHERIFRDVTKLVNRFRLDTVLQAEPRGIG